jgi:hypothetical protein
MDKPLVTDETTVVESRKSRFGSTLTMKGKVINTDTSKITDEQLVELALMAALVKQADA